MSIKKGVILAAGLGTRLLPFTKYLPKPMIPLIDKPAIDYIVQEAFESGIEELGIVCNHLEEVLKEYYKENNKITFIHQSNTWGTAYALKSALDFIANDDFCLFLGDEIVVGDKPCVLQLIDIFEQHPSSVITGVEQAERNLLSEYNVLSIGRSEVSKKLYIDSIIEKPPLNAFLPSSYTSIGRYVIPNEFTKHLSNLKDSPSEETPLTVLFNDFAKKGCFLGYYYDGKRFDIGTKDKWLNAILELSK